MSRTGHSNIPFAVEGRVRFNAEFYTCGSNEQFLCRPVFNFATEGLATALDC